MDGRVLHGHFVSFLALGLVDASPPVFPDAFLDVVFLDAAFLAADSLDFDAAVVAGDAGIVGLAGSGGLADVAGFAGVVGLDVLADIAGVAGETIVGFLVPIVVLQPALGVPHWHRPQFCCVKYGFGSLN